MEGRSRAQTYEDPEDWDDDLALCLVSLLVIHLLQIGQHAALVLGASFVVLRRVLHIDVGEVVLDGNLGQLDQVGDALSIQDRSVQLDELGTVLNDLDHLLDLLEAAAVLLGAESIRVEELEEVLAHLVVDDGLARYLLLLDGELVQNSETEAEREPDAVDLVEFVAFFFKEECRTMVGRSVLRITFERSLLTQQRWVNLRNLN